jgi:hypothetical protein
MRQVNMHEAKTHLLEVGESAAVPRRRLGLLAGQCQVPDDFDQMAAAEIADLFEGR